MKKEMTPEEYLKKVLTTQVSDNCPMRRTLELLNGKWRTHIIYELCKQETCRFGELKKAEISEIVKAKGISAADAERVWKRLPAAVCRIYRDFSDFVCGEDDICAAARICLNSGDSDAFFHLLHAESVVV